ncbi:Cytochrome P450 monooxygenase apf7 [Lachnellula suecica]|uniref:Cytochrome P450 monooxygenase apf7 n=1 Tax=Lachnellula suecica TaxID=602035 RepID=A0A8T9CAS5_9HELO|nr:Cytochrome P450 monooxygenase apf7 [Lachnellula suecica]
MTVITWISTLWYWLPTIGGFGLLAILTRAAYDLWLHPLSKVPGPWFARISGIPSWYHALQGDRHIWIWQLNQIYGGKFRIEPNTVIFCDPSSYNDIYSNTANVQKSTFYPAMQRTHKEHNTFTETDTKLHARKRRLLNLSFTEKSLRAASEFVITHIDRWLDLISEECGDSTEWTAPKDFEELASFLVFDIMGDLAFGNSPKIKEPGENPFKKMPHNIAEYLKFVYPIARSPFLDLVLWLRPKGLDALLEFITPPEIKAYYQFIEDSIAKRTKLQEEFRGKPETQQRLDMFHFLCEAKDPETGAPAYDKNELWAEANLLIIAGADTTSVSLCGIIFYLVRNDRCLEKLVKEIRSTFSTADSINYGPKLQSCVYLKACIEEGMRLTPAGPSELNREVKPGGMTINNEHYPAGVIVGAANWTQSRNDTYGDPYIFRPERWIADEASGVTAESIKVIRANHSPFGRGPRACPGKTMAIMELMLMVAKLLHRLDVRKPPGDTLGEGCPEKQWGERDRNIFQMRDAFITILEGPTVQFRKRES